MKGRGPSLAFAHYYNSFDFNWAPMGMGWSHSLCSSIIEVLDENKVYVFWGDGTMSEFTKTGSGDTDYQDESGNHDILTLVDDGMNYGYNLKKKDQTVFNYMRFNAYPYGNDKIVLLEIKDWKGNKLTFDYQNVTTISDGKGRALKLTYYYPSGQLQKVEEVVNSVIKRSVLFTYDVNGLLETFVDANGRTTQYDYYYEPTTLRHNLLKSITYPKGNTIVIEYDDETITGRVTSIKDSNSTQASIMEYFSDSNMTTVTDPENNKFSCLHPGNLLTAFKGENDANWTTIDRSDTQNPNLPTHVVDKNGNTTDYEYDGNGNLTKITNDRGMVSTFSYNDKNNITLSREFYDPNGTIPPATNYAYDLSGNRLSTITNPENEQVQLGYYPNNQVQSITDGRGYPTTFVYDEPYGNLKQVTDAENNITVYE